MPAIVHLNSVHETLLLETSVRHQAVDHPGGWGYIPYIIYICIIYIDIHTYICLVIMPVTTRYRPVRRSLKLSTSRLHLIQEALQGGGFQAGIRGGESARGGRAVGETLVFRLWVHWISLRAMGTTLPS